MDAITIEHFRCIAVLGRGHFGKVTDLPATHLATPTPISSFLFLFFRFYILLLFFVRFIFIFFYLLLRFYFFTLVFIYSSIYPVIYFSFIHSLTFSFIYPSIQQPIYPSIPPSINLSIHQSIHPRRYFCHSSSPQESIMPSRLSRRETFFREKR